MKHGQMRFALVAFLTVGPLETALAAAPKVDYSLNISSINCEGKDRFSYVATWSDVVNSGTYYVKVTNACQLNGQQCTTNAKACQATCTKGQCQGEFKSCQTGRAASVFVVPTNGAGAAQERRYSAPTCR